jgi:hypothetical protein
MGIVMETTRRNWLLWHPNWSTHNDNIPIPQPMVHGLNLVLFIQVVYNDFQVFFENQGFILKLISWFFIHVESMDIYIYIYIYIYINHYSLQQKVSLYAKWFHWILSEFTSLVNRD